MGNCICTRRKKKGLLDESLLTEKEEEGGVYDQYDQNGYTPVGVSTGNGYGVSMSERVSSDVLIEGDEDDDDEEDDDDYDNNINDTTLTNLTSDDDEDDEEDDISAPESVQPKAIGMYMMKKSPAKLKGWQRRYVTLKDEKLVYYSTVSCWYDCYMK